MTLWSKRATIAVILAIALFFSLYKLTESPGVWYDEGMYIQAAANLSEGLGLSFQFAPGHLAPIPALTVSYPVLYPLAILFKIFGHDIIVARGMMVFFLLVFIIAGYFLVKKRWGVFAATLSLALIVTFPPLYGNGKSVLGEVPALLFLALSLISLQRALSSDLGRRKKSWLVAAGLFAGVCGAAKLLFFVFLPVFAFVVLLQWYRRKLSPGEVVLAGLSALLPVLIWFFVQFYSTDSLGVITAYYANPYGVNDLAAVFKANIVNLFTQAGPLYLMLMMVTWTIAIAIRKSKKLDMAAEELAAYVFCVLIILSYLRVVGWFRYIFPAQMVALLYLVPSLSVCAGQITDWAYPRLPVLSERFKRYCVPALVAVLTLWGIYGLMFDSWVAGAYQSNKTAFWQSYFKDAPVGQSFLFYDDPEVVIFAVDRNYYQYLALVSAGGPFGTEWLPTIAAGGVDQIIIRSDTLDMQGKLFLKNYHPVLQAYKYTILDRNASLGPKP